MSEEIERIREAIEDAINSNQNALLLLERDELREKLARAEKKVANLHERLVKRTTREKRLGKEIERLNWLLGCRKREIRELSARAMPEGYSWPKYEDGERIVPGNSKSKQGTNDYMCINGVEILADGSFILHGNQGPNPMHQTFSQHERIKRPPVLADDGKPIEPGQVVYVVCDSESHVVDHIEYEGGGAPNVYYEDGGWDYPDVISHSPEVLAADGEPLEVGQTVWSVKTGEEFFVSTFVGDLVNVSNKKGGGLQLLPYQLTHQRPVLDAEGVPINVGDTVYGTGREGHEYIVRDLCRARTGLRRFSVLCHDVISDVDCFCDKSQLTHKKPEQPDTWEQIDKDATELADRITTELQGHDYVTTRHYLRYLVRRCKKLAGVSE